MSGIVKLSLVLVISWSLHLDIVQGQWGDNRGPIYFSYPNPYCQRNLIPHYPVREDWILGSWKLLHEYQQAERYDTECKTVDFKKPFSAYLSAKLETNIRVISTSERHTNETSKLETSTFVAYHGGPGIESRYITDKTDGLFYKSANLRTYASALVFLGFTSKLKDGSPTLDPYDSALYAVCSHQTGLSDFGGAFISEVGILSKSGEISDHFMEYYKKLLEEEEIMDPSLLQPVNQNCEPPSVVPKGRGFGFLQGQVRGAQAKKQLAQITANNPLARHPERPSQFGSDGSDFK